MLKNLNHAQCFNIAPMERAWFMVPMEYNPMGKILGPRWNIPSWSMAPMEKAWFCERLFFKVVIIMLKSKKLQHKRYNVNQT